MNHCECNMNCDPHLTTRIKHVYGNVLRLAIPLTLRSLMKDGDTIVATDSDFIPSSEYPVNVVFGKGNKNIAIPAEMDGNVAIIEEKGKMPVGTYDITVECRDDLGQPYRFKKDTVLQVVDVTAEAGIEPTIEYEAQTWYLDAAVFLATTEIGSMGEEIERRLEDVFGDVDYDAENKEIVFYDKNKTHVLGTIDSRPFIVDGTVDDVYIDVSRQVLVVILNEDAGGRRFSVPLYLVFDNYYKKDEVDSKVDHKADVLDDGRLPGAEATPVVLDYIYAPASGSPIIPINPHAGEVIYFANEKKIRRYYYEDAGQSGGLPAIVYVEETPSRYVVYYNKGNEKFYRYDAGLLSMVEIVTGGGDGTVTGVKVGSTTYEPTDGVVDISASIPDVSGFATSSDVADAVADLVDSAPSTLDTLNELAAALGDDPNFATTISTALGNKVDKVSGKGLSSNDYTDAEKTKLEGLSNYDDTALQTAIAGKVDKESGKSLMTDAERTKLQGIAAGAEVNVQPNWTQTNTSADDYIKNKPTLATVATSGSYNDLSNKPTLFSGNYNDLTNKPTIPAAQVNADWNASSGVMEILNKPTIPTKFSDLVDDSDYIKAEDVASIVVGSADVVITETASHINITFVTTSISFTPNTTMSLWSGQKVGTLTVSGTHLKQDITLTVPSGFTAQVSGGTAAQSITIPQTDGEVSGVSVTITYTGADSGSYTGSITATSGSTTASVGLVYSQYQGATIIAGTIDTINAAIGNPQIGELNVSGANLEDNITASVGNGDFTICATQNGTYGNSATISKSSAEASGGATLYVKYTPSSGTSTASDTLTLTTPRNGVNISKTVTLTGAVSTLTLSTNSVSISTDQNVAATGTFTIQGSNLNGGVTLTLTDANSVFSLSKSSLTKAEAEAGETITVTYNSSAAGNHSGSIEVAWDGTSQNVGLSGSAAAAAALDSNGRFQKGGIYYGAESDGNGGWTDNVKVYNSTYNTGATDSTSNKYSGVLNIPSTVTALKGGVETTFNVTGVAEYAFRGNTDITSITLPDTVTSMAPHILLGCTGLTYFNTGNGVTGLPYDFGNGLSALQELVIGDSVVNMKVNGAPFSGCSALRTVTLGSSVQYIGQLLDYNQGNGVTTIICRGESPTIPVVNPSTTYKIYNAANITVYIPSGQREYYVAAQDSRSDVIAGYSDKHIWKYFDDNGRLIEQ